MSRRGGAGLVTAARDAFFELTGRMSYSVSLTELSTASPAPWTRLPREER